MTSERIAKLLELGVNIDETLERFVGNENLYIRCLGKFIDDKNYNLMISSIESGDVSNAFEGAHALKGVAGNLGFSNLYELTKDITEIFRSGSLDYSEENLNSIKSEYKKIIDTINEF